MYLEYPQYTRPPEFHGQAVPEVLLSGHHENIRKWRLEQSMRITEAKRPELLKPELMSKEELKLYRKLQQEKEEANKKEANKKEL